MMVIIHKAQDLAGDVPALRVIAEDPFPDGDPRDLFSEDAHSLADALDAAKCAYRMNVSVSFPRTD